MDLEKKYKTSEGIECNILQLVKLEPEWAANIIQYYEEKLRKLKLKDEPELQHIIDKLIENAKESIALAAHLHPRGLHELKRETIPLLIDYHNMNGSYSDIEKQCPEELKNSFFMEGIKRFMNDISYRNEVIEICNRRRK